jgi:hypothetical protein
MHVGGMLNERLHLAETLYEKLIEKNLSDTNDFHRLTGVVDSFIAVEEDRLKKGGVRDRLLTVIIVLVLIALDFPPRHVQEGLSQRSS